jgi:hypothetical protein
VFASEGTNERYFVSIGAMNHGTKVYTELVSARAETLENAHAIALQVDRFICLPSGTLLGSPRAVFRYDVVEPL